MFRNIFMSVQRCLVNVAVVVLLMLSASLNANADSVKLGYSEGNVVSYYQVAKDAPAGGSAVYFPVTLMQAYNGAEIVSFHLYSSVMGNTTVHFAISGSLDGEPLYEQTVTLDKYGWNEVKLDKPFRLDGSAIYMSYLAEGILNIPYTLSIVDGEEYICTTGSGWQPGFKGFSAALYATVEGDNLPQCNVHLGNIVMPGYARLGQPVAFSGDFINLGTVPVENLTFTYHVGDSTASETIDVAKVEPRKSGTFQLNGLRIMSEGEMPVSVEISAVNGEADFDTSDNMSRTKQVMCLSDFIQRKVLLEVFSTELCTNCPSVHKQLSAVTDTCENIIELGHHAGFYQDPYTIPASKEYEWFYKATHLYAPAEMIDRTAMTDNYPEVYSDSVPVVSLGSSMLKVLYAQEMLAPAFVTVEPSVKTDDSGNLLIHVEGSKLIDSGAESPRLFVFLTEDSVYTLNQHGASEGYYHRHMARCSVTPTWGDPIDLEGYSADYTVAVDPSWNPAKMRVVAFVANYDADDKNNCRVLNAEEVKVPYDGSTGIKGVDAEGLRVTWDGRTLRVIGGYDSLSVCDLSGRVVFRSTLSDSAALNSLAPGYYVATVKRGNKVRVIKILAY